MISWGSIADWVAGCGTAIGLLLAVLQLRSNARAAGQNYARKAWMEYLRLGLENPDIGETEVALRHHRIKDVRTLLSGKTIVSQRYLWFYSIMLEACEALLTYFPTKFWKNTIEYNLSLHRAALREVWGWEGQQYSPALDKFVRRVIYSGDELVEVLPDRGSGKGEI